MNNNVTVIDISDFIEVENIETPKNLPVYSEDFERSRKNILDIIEKGKDALDEFSELALQTQNPRSYEVLSNLIKTMLEANKSLVDLHQTNQRITGENKKGNKGDTVVNNNGNTNIIMSGSTKELLELLNKPNDI